MLEESRKRMARRTEASANRGAGAAATSKAQIGLSTREDAEVQAEPNPETPRFGADEPRTHSNLHGDTDEKSTAHLTADDACTIPDLEDESDDEEDANDEDEEMRQAEDAEAEERAQDDSDIDDDQPNAKRQKLRAIYGSMKIIVQNEKGRIMNFEDLVDEPKRVKNDFIKTVPLRTVVARTMGGFAVSDECNQKIDPAECDDAIREVQVMHALRELMAAKAHVQVKEIIRQLDEDFKAPRITKRGAVKADGLNDVSEVYSPARVTKLAEDFGLKPGYALDLTEDDPDDGRPWDFSDPDKRKKAKAKQDAEKPFMLVVSPMCGPFSTLQNFNYSDMNSNDVMRKMSDALMHIRFAVELCVSQHLAGRLFMFEHPVGASSWWSETLKFLGSLEGVLAVNFDFCTLGMKVGDRPRDGQRKCPVKKRTKVMTNSTALHALLLEAQCRGRHECHADLRNGMASECQEYPEEFCRLVCEAIRRELDTVHWRNKICKSYDISQAFEKLLKVQAKVEKLTVPPEEDYLSQLYQDLDFVDDATGAPLDKEMAIRARKLEIDYFREMGVYTKVAREKWMKVISTRWLDINKGDEGAPNYRARLVGREIKMDKRGDLFAATPPLESLRMIISICAMHQEDQDVSERFVVMSNDVKRAYFHAPATRPVFIMIPDEDKAPGDEHRVGQLNLSLYGTRDAAMNWALRFTKFLEGLGFVTGSATPCNFFHPERKISTTVHGDDFTSTGRESDLRWFEKRMASEFEIKTDVLGPGPGHKRQLRVLNRIIEWKGHGITYEADQRHAEIVIRELGLEQAKAVATPGTRDDASHGSSMNPDDVEDRLKGEYQADTDEDVPLERHEATKYRALSARLNYLAQDRPDLLYAVKEVARRMAGPTKGDWTLMKRVGRYLLGAPRAVQEFPWQSLQSRFDTFVDSDWAGCKSSCRSTSGGVAKIGWHAIKAWSSTQATVAMSSAEAELYALTKGAANTLGFMAVMKDLGYDFNAMLHTDASATLSIAQRQGLGKLRHIRVQYLWVQERLRQGDLTVKKVPGKQNPADLMTKHLSQVEILQHMDAIGVYTSQSRASIAPQLSSCTAKDCDNNDVDKWEKSEDKVVREHHCPRHCLFTPLRVAGAPPARALTALRITQGKFVDNGEVFERRDNWTTRGTAHLQLKRRWVGRTTFIAKSNPVLS